VTKATSFFILGILIGVSAAGGIFSYLGANADVQASNVRVLKLGHALPNNHPVHTSLIEFKRILAEKSGGRLKLEVFPSEQLGTESQCLEKVQAGSLDICKASTAPIGNFVPAYRIFSLPYLFRDEDHYWSVLNGDVGQEMLDVVSVRGDGSPSGLHGLGYFDSGSRSFYTVDPVRTVQDLEGKKIRVMNDPVAMDMVQAMGGSPTPLPFGELYTSLKQGGVDGAENNPPSFESSRHYEICKYYILDHHSRIPDLIVMSDMVWKTLTAQQQGWITEAAAEASKYHRQLWKEETEACLGRLKKEGVTVYEPDDLQQFREKAAVIYSKHSDDVTSPLIKRIQEVQ